MKKIYIDSFSGSLADLKRGYRTEEKALAVLADDPRVSVWDMSENIWLCRLIKNLESNGLIVQKNDPFPWHRFELTNAGREKLQKVRGEA